MRSLLRAEWLRQRRRPDLWLLPIAALAIAAFSWQTGLSSVERSLSFEGGTPPIDLDHVLAQLRDPFLFPTSFHTLVAGGFLAFIAAVHYGASWTGSEFMRGTIRNVFLVHPTRLGFFVARLVALALVALVVVAGLVVLAAVLPALRGVVGSGEAVPPSLLGLAGYASAVWFALWFLALAATTVATLLRSAASAILVILAYVVAELLFVNAPFWQDAGQLAWLPQFLPGNRLLAGLADVAEANGFTQDTGVIDPSAVAVVAPPALGLAIVGAWAVVLLVVLFWRVRSMDIGE